MTDIFTYEESLVAYRQNRELAKTSPKSGYQALDAMIQAFLPGQLTILAGVTSSGKTLFAANISYNVAAKQGRRVLFFSLESGHNPAGAINALSDVEQLDNLRIVKPDHRLTYPDIEAVIKENLHYSDLIVLDHIHYLLDDKDQQMQAKVAQVVRNLQTFAQQIERPILTICHTRKLLSETAIPGLNDLKDSSALFQEPSNVLFVHRFKRDVLDIAVGGEQQMFADNGLLIVSKNRDFGKTGTLRLEFNPFQLSFAVEGEWS